MVKLNYAELNFDHIVEFIKDNTTFAAARENGTTNGNGHHLRLFLITSNGNVYTRNGRVDSWEQLFGSDRDTIIARIISARNHHIPVYRINGNGTDGSIK